jgi:hypothetical protein
MSDKDRFQSALDEFMNLLLQNPAPTAAQVDQLRNTLMNQNGMTEKQIKQIEGKCRTTGLKIPEQPNDTNRETIIITPNKKYDDMCAEIRLKDVLNQFGEAIYGKKFNDGIHGAFGQAQNVNMDVRGKLIILRIPKVFEGYNTRIDYKGLECCPMCAANERTDSRNRIKILLSKMQNSIYHVEKHDVKVKSEYI